MKNKAIVTYLVFELIFKCNLLLAADVPLGLPPLPHDQNSLINSNDKNYLEFGKKLFFDKKLSIDGTVSCAKCHDPSLVFTDGLATSLGVSSKRLARNSPSLFNAIYSNTLFWDGRVNSLSEQAVFPLTSKIEHGFENDNDIVSIVKNAPSYQIFIESAFKNSKQKFSIQTIVDAISTYERTLLSGNSNFDQYYYGKNNSAISLGALRGLEIFRGRAKCSSCHTINDSYALFTDNKFHSSPIELPKDITNKLPSIINTVMRSARDVKSMGFMINSQPEISELGRFVVTLDPRDIGKFKTPSLRNVANTAPYMHDGSVKTLEAAVELELYNRTSQLQHPIVLTANERSDLVSFLRELTSK